MCSPSSSGRIFRHLQGGQCVEDGLRQRRQLVAKAVQPQRQPRCALRRHLEGKEAENMAGRRRQNSSEGFWIGNMAGV